jgi:hypothetical protein
VLPIFVWLKRDRNWFVGVELQRRRRLLWRHHRAIGEPRLAAIRIV